MKKKLIYLMLTLSAMVAFTACSKDDDGDGQDEKPTTEEGEQPRSEDDDGDGLGDKNAGSENTWDVAVTGAVQEKSATGAVITGYANLNLIEGNYSSYKIGIQIGHEGDYNSSDLWGGKEYAHNLVGNKFTITLEGYASGLKWYFRTFVYVNGKYYYGEVKTFYTDEKPNTLVNLVTAGNATDITSNSATIPYSVNPDLWTKDADSSIRLLRGGVLLSNNKSLLTEKFLNIRGIDGIYGHLDNPDDFIIELEDDLDESGEFSFMLDGWFSSHSTYYYCAYTLYKSGKYIFKIGPVMSFTTK